MTNNITWTVLDDANAVAQAASQRIAQAAEQAIAERGAFHLVLAGGSTPADTYRLLARSRKQWQHWHIWFGDERCVAIDLPERNSITARDTLTGVVPIPLSQVHPIPAELGASTGAAMYEEQLNGVLPFDVVLLGLGEDGHTASLFPGHRHPDDALVIPVHDAPKPPPERISLNYPALNQSRQTLILVTGENKRDAVKRWRSGETLPVSHIRASGATEVLIDRDAYNE